VRYYEETMNIKIQAFIENLLMSPARDKHRMWILPAQRWGFDT
jgi:hypothetical protein